MRIRRYNKQWGIFLVITLMVCTPVITYAREITQSDILLAKAYELVDQNPNESIKIAKHLLKKQSSDKELAVLNTLLYDSYWAKGAKDIAVSYAFATPVTVFEKLPDSLKFEIVLRKAKISRWLYLEQQLEAYIKELNSLITLNPEGIPQRLINELLLEKAMFHFEKQEYRKSLELVESIAFKEDNFEYRFYRGRSFLGLEDAGKALTDLMAAVNYYTQEQKKYKEVLIRIELANLYFFKKDYKSSEKELKKALEKTEDIQNLFLIQRIYLGLALNSLALNDKIMYQQYNNEYLKANNEAQNIENDAVNFFYNLFAQEQEMISQNIQERYWNNALRFGFVAVVLLLASFIWFLILKNKEKRFQELISYLEITMVRSVVKPEANQKASVKKYSIPPDTEQIILNKLKRFEGSDKFTNKDMSLATLAAQFDTNTKYLSETINKHYQDNFNTYINKLRINYIIERMKNEPEFLNYKISYLAEVSGFSSHSSFATVFKNITGIAPTVFIELLKEEFESIKKEQT